ncbi:MAG: DUF3179 domain-containing protein [Saprospiraceae bacterium]|nr:DUF3179 domain-containing protein [Saprospiraceae bacterium]
MKLGLVIVLIGPLVITTLLAQNARPISIEQDKFFEREGRKYLYGGKDSSWHFDISGYILKDEQFHYGVGRERFPALLRPNFITLEQASDLWQDDDRFLLLNMEQDVRAYSIKDLMRHEVVNDVVDGKPIMAAYCVLADLGAIYDRTFADSVFTFALSGYTYYDLDVWDGMDGFVMWDRETESLWWPLIGQAVSGPMLGTKMKVLEESRWSQTTWKHIRNNYPNAKILESGQDFERPTSWKRYDFEAVQADSGSWIAPRWGKNSTIN